MSITGTGLLTRARTSDRNGPGATERRTAGRWGARALPSGRAVAGGLLVAVAALGTFAVATRNDAGPTTRYLVLAETVAAGAPLADAVREEAIDLPQGSVDRVVPASSMDRLDGWVAAVDLAPGDLLLRSQLVRAGTGAGYEVAVALDPERSLAGRVSAGGRVDVLATVGDCTSVLVANAELAAVERPGSEFGGSRSVVVLRVPQPADALAVVHAQEAGTLTLARAATAAASPAPTPGTADVPAPVCSAGAPA
jgi:Flp pilus assembly protein CpaB